MAIYDLNETTPYIAVHPGEVIKDELNERGITQKMLASMTGVPASVVNEIIRGKRDLNASYAIAFSKILEIPAESLMRLQNVYDLDVARINDKEVEEISSENELMEYNKAFDVKLVLKRLGKSFISYSDTLGYLKSAFSLPSSVQLQLETAGLFRKSSKTGLDRRMIMTWKMLAEYSARQFSLDAEFDKSESDELVNMLRCAFHENRDTFHRVASILASHGIIFCIMEKVDRASVDGYSFMCGDNPAIIVTKRYDRIDNFAFTVMHELGHVLLHFSGNDAAYLHLSDEENSSVAEQEADAFAQNSLIPDAIWKSAPHVSMNISDIQSEYSKWAKRNCLNKWIVLGRVSYETGIYKFRQDSLRHIC